MENSTVTPKAIPTVGSWCPQAQACCYRVGDFGLAVFASPAAISIGESSDRISAGRGIDTELPRVILRNSLN